MKKSGTQCLCKYSLIFVLSFLFTFPFFSGELSMHLKRLKQFRKNFRENIKEFETDLQATTGRKVTEDNFQPMETTYLNLKVIKSKIRLIKALLDKPEN